MRSNSNAPRNGGASRHCLDGSFRDNSTLLTMQTQRLIGAHCVRPELARVIAGFAFAGDPA